MSLYYRLTDWYVFKGLPKTCWHCEVLGMCRHPKNEGWKFREGSCYLGEDIEEPPLPAKQKKGGKKGKQIRENKMAQKALWCFLRLPIPHLTTCGTGWYNHKAMKSRLFCGTICGTRNFKNPNSLVLQGFLGSGYD